MAGAGMEVIQGVHRWMDATSAGLRRWIKRDDFLLEEVLKFSSTKTGTAWENARFGRGLLIGLS